MALPKPVTSDTHVIYREPMDEKATLAMYFSIGIAAAVAGIIILYGALTHFYMDRLLANPSLAALTVRSFVTLLSVGLPLIAISSCLAIAIKVHHYHNGLRYLATVKKNTEPFTFGQPLPDIGNDL